MSNTKQVNLTNECGYYPQSDIDGLRGRWREIYTDIQYTQLSSKFKENIFCIRQHAQ